MRLPHNGLTMAIIDPPIHLSPPNFDELMGNSGSPVSTRPESKRSVDGLRAPDVQGLKGKRRGRRPDQKRRAAIRSAISKHGDEWREHLAEIFAELDSQEVDLGSSLRNPRANGWRNLIDGEEPSDTNVAWNCWLDPGSGGLYLKPHDQLRLFYCTCPRRRSRLTRNPRS